MTASRSTQVRQAVQAICDFHALGREIPPKTRHKDSYGVVRREAEDRGMSQETIRKARAFADPIVGYTTEELAELCDLIVAEQSGDDDDVPWLFGTTHLIRLLTVRPKRLRRALQARAIKNGWSTARLEAEIARHFGTRRAGGRWPAGARTLEDWLARTERLCETWNRWDVALDRPSPDNRVGRTDLPDDVARALRAVCLKVASLQAVLVGELGRRSPGRSPRTSPTA